MRKILPLAFFLFVVTVGNTFEQTRILEISNDSAEIREAFQKRLYDVSSEFKYFYHLVVSPFDVNETEGEFFNRKAKIAIRKKSTSFLK